MGFGAGVLISALSFDLMDQAYQHGGFDASAIGFLAGALVYTAANLVISRRGGKHRKRSGDQQPSECQQSDSGLAIAVGALLDGIPESIAIGLSMLGGGSVSWVAVIAIFLSNIPEGRLHRLLLVGTMRRDLNIGSLCDAEMFEHVGVRSHRRIWREQQFVRLLVVDVDELGFLGPLRQGARHHATSVRLPQRSRRHRHAQALLLGIRCTDRV
jgi:hypothetical protein